MAKPADAGFGTATAGTLGAAEDIREHASFGILTGTFASGIFPVAHGTITSDFVRPDADKLTAATSTFTASDDPWL